MKLSNRLKSNVNVENGAAVMYCRDLAKTNKLLLFFVGLFLFFLINWWGSGETGQVVGSRPTPSHFYEEYGSCSPLMFAGSYSRDN